MVEPKKKVVTRKDWIKGAELVGIPKSNLTPHPARAFFKQHAIPLWAAAQVIRVNESILSQYLSGKVAMPIDVEMRLDKLLKETKKKLKDANPVKKKQAKNKVKKKRKVAAGTGRRKRGIKRFSDDQDVMSKEREVKGLSW